MQESDGTAEKVRSLQQTGIERCDMLARVLLIGGNPRDLQLIWAALFQAGVALDAATTVDDALSLLRMTPYAAVIIDLDDRRQQALEECRRVRATLGECTVPLIAISAWATQEEVQRSLRAGCDYYLTKPLDLQQLGTLVRDLTPAA